MSTAIQFDPLRLPPECEELRSEVREFVREEIAAGTFDPNTTPMGNGLNREFARKVGERGWIGMTWPKQFGGQERSFLERYVVTEEFRAVAAPTRVFFTADRQSGPTIIKYGNEEMKADILPRIIKGECMFCIGMSEPNSGSDLFAASCRATKTDGGWLINGSKVWTSGAHHADYMIGLFRTSQPTEKKPSPRIDELRGRHEKYRWHYLPPDPASDRHLRIQRSRLRERLRLRRYDARHPRRCLETGDE
jgi:acyl-CoA dehydrogenase